MLPVGRGDPRVEGKEEQCEGSDNSKENDPEQLTHDQINYQCYYEILLYGWLLVLISRCIMMMMIVSDDDDDDAT